MRTYLLQIRLLLERLALAYLLFILCRFLFYIHNRAIFLDGEAGETIPAFIYGLRFDTYSILAGNILFILLSIIPASFVFREKYQSALKTLFITVNAVFFFMNCIDVVYFTFTKKRSTSDIFNQIFGGQTDVLKQLPDYFRDFWWIMIAYVVVLFLFIRSYPKQKIRPEEASFIYTKKNIASYSALILLIAGLCVIGLRGGLQRIPIKMVDAALYVQPQHAGLVLNTPFTIIKSAGGDALEELHFMSTDSARALVEPEKQFAQRSFKAENVVILILESFSKEYTGIGQRKSYTPFLDSLFSNSLVFTNAWANGTRSIEGIPAILSGIPTLMNNPYINSQYCTNELNTLPNLLKTQGYSASFFHGGLNGTMNFDAYAKQAGFDNYFGKNEYNNDADFDGNWGIWDEPYLQYCAEKIGTLKAPFFASVFTLSSHHPYKVPEKYQNKFPRPKLEILESIGYADYSLGKFFDRAKTMPWYNNTLFVLVADHASISDDKFYANNMGQHCIPLAFFRPDNSLKGVNTNLIQQIDIMPSLLEYMGFNKPFFSFGKSVFSKPSPYIFFFDSGNYYLCNDSLYFGFSGYNASQTINFRRDSVMARNLLYRDKASVKQAESYLRGFIEFYNHSLISNTARLKP